MDTNNEQVRELDSRLLTPIVQSVQNDVKEIKEMRKSHEKMRDRYEGAAAKFGSIPKLREFPLIREDAFQLYENRKSYYQHLFSYVVRINKFKMGADLFLVDRCLETVGQLDEFSNALSEMLSAVRKPAGQVKSKLLAWQNDIKLSMARLEKEGREQFESVRTRYSPDAPFEQSKGAQKSGHLFLRKQKGLGIGWKRVYLSIANGTFFQQSLGRMRGTVDTSLEINVLLCEIRQADSDRRHCFEVQTSQKSYMYQAESEEDMRDWIRAFESAKNHVLRIGKTNKPAADSPSLNRFSLDPKELLSEEVEHTDDDPSPISTPKPPLPARSALLPRSLSLPATPVEARETQVLPTTHKLPFPPSETLFFTLPCVWEGQDAKMFGRMYATERALYLCSRIFGTLGEKKIPWVDVRDLAYSASGMTGLIQINCGAAMELRVFIEDRTSGESFSLLLRNAQSTVPKSVVELRTMLNPNFTVTEIAEESRDEQRESTSMQQVHCECKDHLDQTELNVILPLPIDPLFGLMLGEDAPVLTAIHKKRGYRLVHLGPWTVTEEGEQRDLRLIVPINHPLVKAKEAECFERQILQTKTPGRRYVIRTETRIPGIIYGDSFVTIMQYCLTHHAENKTRLKSHIGILWIKSPMVKSLIRSTTIKSLSEYMRDYLACVCQEIRKLRPELALPSMDSSEEEGELGPEVGLDAHDRASPSKTRSLKHTAVTGLETVLGWLGGGGGGRRSKGSNWILSAGGLVMGVLFVGLVWGWVARKGAGEKYVSLQYLEREFKTYKHPDSLIDYKVNAVAASGTWSSAEHKGIFHKLTTAHSQYSKVRKDLHLLLSTLNSAECLVFQAQYVTWLADRLGSCYADLSHPTSACLDFENAWSLALKESCQPHPDRDL